MQDVAPSFFARLAMAFVCFFKLLFNPRFAQSVRPLYLGFPSEPQPSPPLPAPTEQTHASGLFLLSMLQREGRFIDFLQEEVAGFDDAQVGAAARVVHAGCRKVVHQYLSLKPVMSAEEGDTVDVPKGFDAQKIRLTGNLEGEPPYKGSLRHHGWATTEVKLPEPPVAVDPKILAPAEVELS